VNVSVENLSPCKKLLRIEIEAPLVTSTFEEVTRDFQRHAALPGFRPGKAPRTMVENAYGARIEEEVKRKLISESYRKALDQEKLNVVTQPDIEEVQFGKGEALQFTATVETAPDFELPEYKGLSVKAPPAAVTDADVEAAIEVLRNQRAVFTDIEREAREGDFVVVNYTGTCDGKPITDTAPTAKGLTEQKSFWIHVQPEAFIPGFGPQLIGAKAGDKRTVNVDFPADFVTPQLAGKQGVYEVEVLQVKEKTLPALDDEFGKSFGAEGLDKLREGVREDLKNDREMKRGREIRNQLVSQLLQAVKTELPESMVQAETRNVIRNIVRDSQERGATRETIEQQKNEIYAVAANSAKDRVKAGFVLGRIADKENIKVSKEEIANRVMVLAHQYEMKPEQLAKQLRENDGFGEVHEQIMVSKVLDFIQEHAQVEDVAPPQA
jgi:trigger factor